MPKIAVVGAGIFGCTAAIFAARAGYQVDLYEKSDDILSGASSHNQFRLHEGYHYPRSPKTVEECRRGMDSFSATFGNYASDGQQRHLYAIAKGSQTTAEQYLEFLRGNSLPFRKLPDTSEHIDLFIECYERWYDPYLLRKIVKEKLHFAGVNVLLNRTATERVRYDYAKCIVACYADTNRMTARIPGYEQCRLDKFQFEVVEKPVIWLSDRDWRNTGLVVMDGPFGCIDPYGTSGLHVMGHVELAIHRTNTGFEPQVPYYLLPLINKGIIANPGQSNFSRMKHDLVKYIPALANAYHVGSMFTVRAVLPDRDATDERPTLVEYLEKDQHVIRIFGGKVGTCVEAARQAVEMIHVPA